MRQVAECDARSADGALLWQLRAPIGVGHVSTDVFLGPIQSALSRRVVSIAKFFEDLRTFEIASHMQEECVNENKAYSVATIFAYGWLRKVVLAFASEDDGCGVHIEGEGVLFALRCDPDCARISMRTSGSGRKGTRPGRSWSIYTIPEGPVCSVAERWHCDMPTIRMALFDTWAELMRVRPEDERRRVVESVASYLARTRPEPLRRRLATLFRNSDEGRLSIQDLGPFAVLPTEFLTRSGMSRLPVPHRRARGDVARAALAQLSAGPLVERPTQPPR